MVKLVIFDLDGTLLNTIEDLADSLNHALAECGYPTHSLEAFKYFIGGGVKNLIKRSLPEEHRDDQTFEKVRSVFIPYYDKHSSDKTRPYDGVMGLLDELSKRNVKLAIASNKHHSATVPLVDLYFKGTKFAEVSGQKDGVAVKPDPSIVNNILSSLGIEKSEALYVGDSDVDMQTAKNASVFSVGVSWGFRPVAELKENGAMAIVNTPSEIIELL